MSKTSHNRHGDRRIRVRGIQKNPPDLRRLARAFIALAQSQAEAEAEASAKSGHKQTKSQTNKTHIEPVSPSETSGDAA